MTEIDVGTLVSLVDALTVGDAVGLAACRGWLAGEGGGDRVKLMEDCSIMWRVPEVDRDPGEDMIEFLSLMLIDWDGDESGVTICVGEDEEGGDVWEIAGPGDYVVRKQFGAEWGVFRLSDLDGGYDGR